MRTVVPRDLPLACRCGAVRGVAHGVAPNVGNHCVCFCDDCQAFAKFLGRDRDVLDPNGGTDIFQLSPARVTISEGRDRLACLRLTPRGPLRWYAACCNTPIGNTLATGRLPFLGLVLGCVDAEGRSLDELLGPVRLRIMARFARGELGDPEAHERFVLSHVLAIFRRMLRWRIRGDHKRSPFFDPTSGEPVSPPTMPGGTVPPAARRS